MARRKKVSKKRVSKKGVKVRKLDTEIGKLAKKLQTLEAKKKQEQIKVLVEYGIDVPASLSKKPAKKATKKVAKKATAKKVGKKRGRKKKVK